MAACSRRRVVRLFEPPALCVAHAAARLQLVPPPRRCSTRARPDTCRACSLTPRQAAARTPAVLRSALMLTCQAGPLACMRAVNRWRAGAELSGASGGAAVRRRHVLGVAPLLSLPVHSSRWHAQALQFKLQHLCCALKADGRQRRCTGVLSARTCWRRRRLRTLICISSTSVFATKTFRPPP